MKYIILFALSASLSLGTYAQSAFVLSYPIGFTMGGHHDYISQTSFRGITMEYVHKMKENIAIGLEVGWNVFYQKEDEKEYKEGTASITGVQYRYTNAVPLIAESKYLFASSGKNTVPYVGFGLGTLYVNRTTDFGLYRIVTDAWQFCLRPEAGVMFKFQSTVHGFIGAKYNAAFDTDALDAQSYLTVNIGFIFSSGGW
jgi:hypothetical protein